MEHDNKLILLQAKWDEYRRFQNLCCVDSMPAVVGPCWTAAIQSVDGLGLDSADAAFIGYSYAFRNNSCRLTAIPELWQWGMRGRMAYLNRHVRCLTRIMVRPEYRGQGIASKMIMATLPLLGVTFVECLTFTEGIARILERCGFQKYGRTGGMNCDYYLWSKLRVKGHKDSTAL